MSYYSLTQWLLFFYISCFIGWIWECCYVSVRKREWVNRGFLHGPFLPIYGSGAIVILLSTINVRDSIPLIFIMGMISSTILEFVTGCCMEKLFGVRYWDYSDKPFNVKGYISDEIGKILDKYKIEVRTGLHCSPSAHEFADSLETGVVRVSPSIFNTKNDIDRFINVVKNIK